MEIRLYATLRQVAGAKLITIPDAQLRTVRDALLALLEVQPALKPLLWNAEGTLVGHVAVILNGRDIRSLNGVDTPMSSADRLDIFPPVGGG